MNTYRIIDAEINRVSEGIRVIEDITRFSLNNKEISEELRILRHSVRSVGSILENLTIKARDAKNDIGVSISQNSKIDSKHNINDLINANFKRIQEGLRSLEESLKIVDNYKLSKAYEKFRFNSYSIEKKVHNELNFIKRSKCLNTELYGITGSKYSKGRTNQEVVSAMINAGIKVIQYREKEKSLKEKLSECHTLRKLTQDAGVSFIINDDVTLAQIINADGIHLGQDDLPLTDVRRIVGEEMIIGLSTHSHEQAKNAVQIGADYIGVGPIFKTFTKVNVCDPVGYEYLDWVVQNIKIPFVAIGGIKLSNIQEIISRKATCIALVTEIVGANNIEETIHKLKKIVGSARI